MREGAGSDVFKFISVEPLSDGIGARVTGVNLCEGLNDEVMREIRQAWIDHFVIVLPGQSLSSDEQVAFTAWFGPRQPVRTVQQVAGGLQNYMYVANRCVDGMEGVLPEGEMQYHSDQCYYETPSRATILYALDIPEAGGNTKFANAYSAYESLPLSTKELLTGVCALNVYDYQANPTHKRNESSPEAPRYAHPAVIRHPETGRAVLYVNRLMTDHVVGMERADSDVLLEQLFQVLENPAHCYEHVWRRGDLVMWDNLCTQHARTWFDPSMTRVLRRTSLAGGVPEAA
ncbi:MAG: TauD/TfdA family dioxygenase [Pseudomonadota bacterium]|nr:TauD/TfdA family dioxygenase [Pseudomonadota bacterium]